MAEKPKPRGRPEAPRKPKAKAKEKSQRERFIETARDIGVDDREFERSIRAIVPPKRGAP